MDFTICALDNSNNFSSFLSLCIFEYGIRRRRRRRRRRHRGCRRRLAG